ncbi:dicarboxylate/amino acid:cation symporter [Paraferrimonas sp. SM1919]|uniref:dicarboxylate/amino acid:cation symporter n=1 Tax=Paraferrimonas sp. SM1919 TaxID=2662263 RepID=UPI0013D524C2|nr:dicarboxylate/amino acid:cation symporter [Paraferrimonas sp. SM1919]
MFKTQTSRIFLGLFAGLLIGSIIQYDFPRVEFLHTTFLEVISGLGSMFVHLIMLLVVPLVFFSIVAGIVELQDIKSFGRLGGKTFFLYLVNTVLAILATMAIALAFEPGLGLTLAGDKQATLGSTSLPSFLDMIVNIIPSNPARAFVEGDMLQIIFMAILTGAAIKSLGEVAKPAEKFFKMGNTIMLKMINMVMTLAPLGVFVLMIKLGATLSASMMIDVAGYIAMAVGLMVFWSMVFYPFIISLTTDISASEFRRKTREQFIFAVSTSSSSATMPVTMRTLTDGLKVKKSIAGFGVPMGATMNMSGAAIYIGMAAFFIGNAFGQPITSDQLLTLGVSVFLLSVGAGAVPGGGVVMVGVLIHQMGLPVESIAIIAAIDRIKDMFATATNVVGDSAVITLVDASEKGEEALQAEQKTAQA